MSLNWVQIWLDVPAIYQTTVKSQSAQWAIFGTTYFSIRKLSTFMAGGGGFKWEGGHEIFERTKKGTKFFNVHSGWEEHKNFLSYSTLTMHVNTTHYCTMVWEGTKFYLFTCLRFGYENIPLCLEGGHKNIYYHRTFQHFTPPLL